MNPYGSPLGLRINDVKYLPRIEELVKKIGWERSEIEVVDLLFSLKIGAPPKRGRRNFHLLYLGGNQLERNLDLEVVFDKLESMLIEIARMTAKNTVILAASLLSHNNRTLLLPALSETGRTTLIEALEAQGAELAQETFVQLDESGQFTDPNGRHHCVDLICFTEYSSEYPGFQPLDLSPGELALHGLAHAVTARNNPQLAMQSLAALAAKSQAIKGPRGEAEVTARALLSRLAESA